MTSFEASSVTHPGSPGGGRTTTCDPVTCSDRTSALLRGISVVLQEHDAPVSLIENIKKQIEGYLNDAPDELVWVRRCKYLLALPLSRYLHCEAPCVPDRAFIPRGLTRRWMKNRLNAFSRKNTHLWYSWFQCKRCTLVCSDLFIGQTYDDHKKALTKADPGDPFAIDAAFSDPTFFRVLEKVRSDIEEALLETGGVRYLDPSELFPSSSACFQTTRLSGGQFLALKRKCLGFEANHTGKQHYYMFTPFTDELYRMEWFPQIFGMSDHEVEVRQPYGFDDWIELIRIYREMNPDRRLGAEIQGVLEPLKVRVISKGECIPYYFHKHLQRALHTSLREMPCFRLIGRPFCPTDILDLKKVSKPEWSWFSIDYSAATDGLSWRFSETILRVLLANFPERERDWALRVLGPHDLYYPKGFGEYAFGGTQTNGQLMGSILSFPILCLANLATYLLTMRSEQIGWGDSKRLAGVLVNGDDMVYPAPAEKWDRHVKVASDLGLQMSVGKAYRHRTYLNINSTSVHCDLFRESTPFQINYLNTGLYFSSEVQKKKGGNVDKVAEEASGLVPSINTLLEGCVDERGKRRILAGYLSLHSLKIREECVTDVLVGNKKKNHQHVRNLFLPHSLGGMGVQPPIGFRFKIKPFDRVLAANQLLPGMKYSLGRPLCGPEVTTIKTERSVAWKKMEGVRDARHQIRDLHLKIPRGFRSEVYPVARVEFESRYCLPCVSGKTSLRILEGPIRAKNGMGSQELKHPKSVQEFMEEKGITWDHAACNLTPADHVSFGASTLIKCAPSGP